MLADLDHLTAYQVEDACANYRRDPANKFFPSPGQLMEARKGTFSEPVSRLKKFDPAEFDAPRTAVLKPIGQILREHGFDRAADKWDARK